MFISKIITTAQLNTHTRIKGIIIQNWVGKIYYNHLFHFQKRLLRCSVRMSRLTNLFYAEVCKIIKKKEETLEKNRSLRDLACRRGQEVQCFFRFPKKTLFSLAFVLGNLYIFNGHRGRGTNYEKKKKKITYVNAAKTFNKVDFPAPDGPMMAVNSPDLNSPLTPLRIFLVARKIRKKIKWIRPKWFV